MITNILNSEDWRAFVDLYIESSPDINEREDVENWFYRENPLLLVFMEKEEDSDNILGGIVAEYSSYSKTYLITDLFVTKDASGQGIDKKLITLVEKELMRISLEIIN